jgi:succinate semialdehyde reductase (NADPH)
MKAAVLRAYKEPLQVEELAVEAPHVGEIAVKVAAASVCHSDLYILEGATPVPPPLVPGHEAVGVMEEVGSDVDGLSPGDFVVTSFIWPCGRCKNCASGRENPCENFVKVRLKGTLLDGTTRLRDGGGEARIYLGGTCFQGSARRPWRRGLKTPAPSWSSQLTACGEGAK